MAWPDSRLATFVDGTPPTIDADTLNAMQDAIGDVWGGLYGRSRILFHDDFLYYTQTLSLTANGTFHDTWRWTLLTGSPALKNQDGITLNDADGSPGNAYFITVGGAAASSELFSPSMAAGTRDYRFACRVRIKALARLDTLANHGLLIGLAGTTLGFRAGNNNGNWQVNDFAGTNHDSGVAINDNTYYTLEVARIGGQDYWLINGTPVYTPQADANSYSLFLQMVVTNLGSLSAGAEIVALDYVNFGPIIRP